MIMRIYLLVTSPRSMFIVNDARCTNQLEAINIDWHQSNKYI